MNIEPRLHFVRSVRGEPVAEALDPLLLAVFDELRNRGEKAPERVANAMHALLTYLSSPIGRTNANCAAADTFFCLREGWGDVGWEHLPDELGDILALAGSSLHDTVQAPEIAQDFGCTPEQLLENLLATGLVRFHG